VKLEYNNRLGITRVNSIHCVYSHESNHVMKESKNTSSRPRHSQPGQQSHHNACVPHLLRIGRFHEILREIDVCDVGVGDLSNAVRVLGFLALFLWTLLDGKGFRSRCLQSIALE